MKKPFQLILFLLYLLIPYFSYSSHIVGGEISYRHLGNNIYEIRVTAYRDCYNGQATFDNPIALGVFDSSNTLFQMNYISVTSMQSLNNSTPNCFVGAPVNICYEKATYIYQVTLPPIPGGYQLAYQRCCRPSLLTNIADMQITGATYYSTIPDSTFYDNNSPVFDSLPFTFLCLNNPFSFDNSATDADGDSLVYSLSTPLAGGSITFPRPDPTDPPPYQLINWNPPYSLSNVMGGIPLQIDPQTGILSGTPNAPGVFAFSVCAKEFRNGNYLGETRRDFSIYVVNFVNIPEIELIRFSCAPNPFHNETIITITGVSNYKNMKLRLYNGIGECVLISDIHSNEIIIDGIGLIPGIYFYRVVGDGGFAGSGKLVME